MDTHNPMLLTPLLFSLLQSKLKNCECMFSRKVSFHMIKAYEAYITHYASSSKHVTSLFLSEAASARAVPPALLSAGFLFLSTAF